MESTELEKYRHDLAFLMMMADQTIKDFDRFSYDLQFNEQLPVNFNNYVEQLCDFIKVCCKTDSNRLSSLLYGIDVPEHLLPPRSGCADPKRTAEVILQRELIKVVMRKLYAG